MEFGELMGNLMVLLSPLAFTVLTENSWPFVNDFVFHPGWFLVNSFPSILVVLDIPGEK